MKPQEVTSLLPGGSLFQKFNELTRNNGDSSVPSAEDAGGQNGARLNNKPDSAMSSLFSAFRKKSVLKKDAPETLGAAIESEYHAYANTKSNENLDGGGLHSTNMEEGPNGSSQRISEATRKRILQHQNRLQEEMVSGSKKSSKNSTAGDKTHGAVPEGGENNNTNYHSTEESSLSQSFFQNETNASPGGSAAFTKKAILQQIASKVREERKTVKKTKEEILQNGKSSKKQFERIHHKCQSTGIHGKFTKIVSTQFRAAGNEENGIRGRR